MAKTQLEATEPIFTSGLGIFSVVHRKEKRKEKLLNITNIKMLLVTKRSLAPQTLTVRSREQMKI